jgi:hypothetical protein
MDAMKFRKDLLKIMPGYKWTVHKDVFKTDPVKNFSYFEATGIQVCGLNRMSTLRVVYRERDGVVEYDVKSSGFGKKAPWLAQNADRTLAKALRGLQNHYDWMASEYSRHAHDMAIGRKPPS